MMKNQVVNNDTVKSGVETRLLFRKQFAEVAAKVQRNQPANPKSATKANRKKKSAPEEPGSSAPTLEQCAEQAALSQEANPCLQRPTTESNVRRKARRRGYSVSKYRRGYDDAFAATHWAKGSADICDARLRELEEFIDRQPLENRSLQGGSQ